MEQYDKVPMLPGPARVVLDGHEATEAQLSLLNLHTCIFALLVLAARSALAGDFCSKHQLNATWNSS